jgi:hypothetical protein
MKRITTVVTICLAAGAAAALPGCEKETAPPAKPAESVAHPSKPAAPATTPQAEKAPPTMPANHPGGSPAAESAAATIDGSALKLTGVMLTLPKGWESEPAGSGPMAPVAVLRIPRLAPDGEDGTVRITYFPNMKGMDESNIERWVGQVAKADGQPATRADAEIKVAEMGNVRLTTVDLTGAIKLAMRDTAKPNTRMIAAIVDHPKGPHFVVSAGDAKSMETWGDQIVGFLKSAKAE